MAKKSKKKGDKKLREKFDAAYVEMEGKRKKARSERDCGNGCECGK